MHMYEFTRNKIHDKCYYIKLANRFVDFKR